MTGIAGQQKVMNAKAKKVIENVEKIYDFKIDEPSEKQKSFLETYGLKGMEPSAFKVLKKGQYNGRSEAKIKFPPNFP
ncbi:hypothetical protein FACS189459_6380 [Bacilli bacterium]|nr:hypothetical protein FACS189459_6380 [Bacilli bacterium]GHU52211.1 hypothetical protein FACS189496_1980 [Bacilli bacterium]